MARAEVLPGMRQQSASTFRGEVRAVKARIRLIRSFDEVSHQYQGYVPCLNSLASEGAEVLRVAIRLPLTKSISSRLGTSCRGKAQPVTDGNKEFADVYKVSGIKVERRGPLEQRRPADPEGGIAPPLAVYRANGHRRLQPHTCATKCDRCPWASTLRAAKRKTVSG